MKTNMVPSLEFVVPDTSTLHQCVTHFNGVRPRRFWHAMPSFRCAMLPSPRAMLSPPFYFLFFLFRITIVI